MRLGPGVTPGVFYTIFDNRLSSGSFERLFNQPLDMVTYMRSLIVSAFAVAAIAICILAMPSADAEDESIVSYQGMNFYVMPDSTDVKLISVDEDAYVANLQIPKSFPVGSTTYDVVSILMESVCSDVVTSIDFMGNDRLSEISDTAFECPNLAEFTGLGPSVNDKFVTEGGILYGISDTPGFRSIVRAPPAIDLTSYEVINCDAIMPSAFNGCTKLQEITFDPSVKLTEIPSYTFENCTSLSKIGYDPADGYNHLPDTIILIRFNAFYGCSSLGNICMPESLRIIEDFAFAGCGFERFHLNTGISYIEDRAFSGCINLTSFEYIFDQFYDTPGYAVIDGILYSDGRIKTLVCYPAGKTGETYTLNEKVTGISRGAFSGTKYLKNFEVNTLLTAVDIFAFESCTSLESVDLKGRVTTLDMCAFSDCVNLRTVNGMSGVVTIGESAFENCGITSIDLPSSIKSIGGWAFSGSKLASITVPDAEVSMGTDVFLKCTGLKDITFEGDSFTLVPGSLNIGTEDSPAEVTVHIIRTASIPSDACNDGFTTVKIDKEGEHPYPYENLIGVFVCLLILLGIIRIIKEV